MTIYEIKIFQQCNTEPVPTNMQTISKSKWFLKIFFGEFSQNTENVFINAENRVPEI